jgi:branched-chain amino acid transport system permease protein
VFPFLHNWPFFGGFISEFRTFNATMFAVWLLVVLSMNLLTGYSGQISLGHAAVMLVGAYTTAVLFDQYGVPLGLAVLMAGLFTGVLGGVVIGFPAVRLAGPYLAIATFSLIITMPQILKIEVLMRWTNGAMGIPTRQVQPPGFVDGFLDQRQWIYYAAMGTAVVMTILFWNLTRSRIGRAFVALRDSEIGAEQMGVNVPLYKALAFGISSLYAGIAGGLYFMVQAFVAPESLGFLDSILFLVAIVVGGLATILGSIFGALFMTFQSELISELAKIVPEADRMRGVIYGFLLIGMMIFFPRGMAGFVHSLAGWRSMWERTRVGTITAFGTIMARKGATKPTDEEPDSPPGEAEENNEDEEQRG